MAKQFVYEGLPHELAPYLARHPHTRFRLIELTPEDDITESDVVSVIDAENAAAIALLKSWREQDAADDPEELRKAEEEYAEFKRNMNANRAATGERLVYP